MKIVANKSYPDASCEHAHVSLQAWQAVCKLSAMDLCISAIS